MNSCFKYAMKNSRLILSVLLCFTTSMVFAATSSNFKGGVEFATFYNLVWNWATGYFGRALAIGAFLIGCIVGIMGKPIMALVGIAFAIILTVGPGITDGMFSALI